jgi:hypothetical protein
MKITKRQLRRIIKESKGWFLLGLDGTLAKSQKTRTPIWWSNEAGAQQAYDSGYGGEGAVPVEILLAPDPYAYNGSDADPADLESVRQHWAPGTLNKVPSELGESKMRITKRRLRRIIRQTINESQTAGPPISGKHAIALGGSYGKPPSNPDPKGALAAAREMGYSLDAPMMQDGNQQAIDDALASYPGEFTYEDIVAAVTRMGGA